MKQDVIHALLGPLSKYYADKRTVEIRINRPGVVVVDRRGEGKKAINDNELTISKIEAMCKNLAIKQKKNDFNASKSPHLSCVIPGDDQNNMTLRQHRFECLLGPSTQTGVSLAIRCKHEFEPEWSDIGIDDELLEYLRELIAVRRAKFIVSGGTNTGKTTLMNKLINLLPDSCRLIAIENAPEINISKFWDGQGLLAANDGTKAGGMRTWSDLYNHLNRITPDVAIWGEASVENAFGILSTLNSGIQCCGWTMHASDVDQALDRKLEQNAAWAGMPAMKVSEYTRELVDCVIQLRRDSDGMRRISQIYEPTSDKWVLGGPKRVSQGQNAA